MRDFEPKFTTVSTFMEAADQINRPHEDYPDRVQRTFDMIENLQTSDFDYFLIRQIHSYVMHDMEPSMRGVVRSIQVTVNGQPTPEPWEIPQLLEAILPVTEETDIKDWYRRFQLIYPFADGNGRVGGIILSIHSYVTTKEILAPLQ